LKLHYTSAIQARKFYSVAQAHYDDFYRLLITAPDIVMVATLMKVYDSNDLIRNVVQLFTLEGKAIHLINHIVYRELKATTQEETLFRTDSSATKTIVTFLKANAINTLHDLIGPIIREITSNPNGYEVDPEKFKGDTKPNLERLRITSQKIFDTIIADVTKWPVQVRVILQNVRKLVAGVFPNSQLKAVGAFVFLRFLCPSLIAPESFGLLKEPPSKEARRALTLIAKVLQNLANNVTFKKEAYMLDLNSFVEQNQAKMLNFYKDLSTITDDVVKSKMKSDQNEEKLKELATLIDYFSKHIAQVGNTYPQDPRAKTTVEREQENKKIFEELKSLTYA